MIEAIEDAIAARLKSEIADLKTVDSYAGQFEAEVPKLLPTLPAAFIAWPSSRFDGVAYNSTDEKPRFTVLVAAKDLRSQAKARKGDAGAATLVRAALQALRGQNLGLEIERLKPEGISLVYTARGLVVYGLDMSTGFTL
ncbi:MAG: hypothetical protein C0621_07440 [Desulfuromonas sp.]|nr:MAG: hypothetical protein C0621_07440 [Desulfuromonas sp.]